MGTRRSGKPVAGREWEAPRAPRAASPRARALRRVALWSVLLLASFGAVVWRQTLAVERERELRRVQAELAVVEATRVDLTTRIQTLQTRARIVRVARDRLGLHAPGDAEIVLLPVAADTAPYPSNLPPTQ